jgi:hypothetical protein
MIGEDKRERIGEKRKMDFYINNIIYLSSDNFHPLFFFTLFLYFFSSYAIVCHFFSVEIESNLFRATVTDKYLDHLKEIEEKMRNYLTYKM